MSVVVKHVMADTGSNLAQAIAALLNETGAVPISVSYAHADRASPFADAHMALVTYTQHGEGLPDGRTGVACRMCMGTGCQAGAMHQPCNACGGAGRLR